VDGLPVQVIAPFGAFALPVEDLSPPARDLRGSHRRRLAGRADETILPEPGEMSDKEAESALAGVGGALNPITEDVR
jgi:hypothetical protein